MNWNPNNRLSSRSFPQTEEGWIAEWEATPKLQEVFPNADSYAATMKHEARKAARAGGK